MYTHTHTHTLLTGMPSPPLLHTQRVLLGSGHEWGGLYTEITNNHPGSEVKLLYLDMVPWFCRVFIHTLQVDNGRPDSMECGVTLVDLHACYILVYCASFHTQTHQPLFSTSITSQARIVSNHTCLKCFL